MLILFLSQSIFFHSLQLSFFFFKLLFFDRDVDVQLLLDLSFVFQQLLFSLLELVVTLFYVALNDLTDVNGSLLKLVKDGFELSLVP